MTIGTVIAGSAVIIAVILAVRRIIKDRKSGGCSCSFSCSGCSMREQCHHREKGSDGTS